MAAEKLQPASQAVRSRRLRQTHFGAFWRQCRHIV